MEIHLDAATVGQLPARLATLVDSPDDLAVLLRLAASAERRVPMRDLVAALTARGMSAPRAVAVVRDVVARWVAARVVEHVGGGYRLADPVLTARLVAASPSLPASPTTAAPLMATPRAAPVAPAPPASAAPALAAPLGDGPPVALPSAPPTPPVPGPEVTSVLQHLALGRAAPLPPASAQRPPVPLPPSDAASTPVTPPVTAPSPDAAAATTPRPVVVLTGAQVLTDPVTLTRLAPGDRVVIDLRAAGAGTPTELLPTATPAPPPTAVAPPRTLDLLAAALAGAQAAPAPSRRTARRAVGRAAGLASLLDHLLHGAPPAEDAPNDPSPAVLVLAAPEAPPPDPAALAVNLPPGLGVEVVLVDDDGAAIEEVLAWLGDGDDWTLLPPRA